MTATLTKPLQRIGEVRRQEEMSLRTLQRRLGGVHMNVVKKLDNPETDMRLSDLSRVAEAMDVPLGELLCDSCSADPTKILGSLIRISKIANTLLRRLKSPASKRLLESLKAQIDEHIPSEAVGELHEVGQRRSFTDYGRAALAPIPTAALDLDVADHRLLMDGAR